ncbi:MAG: FeoC-like transcriptional regulator [Burkholderiaceae bacterium]|nr:FeoC-like transcriptional regulator [Burkholderiaceae bacterium]
MILSKVSNYLKLNRRAALNDMASVLDISPNALRAMLDRLEAKGSVRRLPSGTSCGGSCSKCKPQEIELYEWCS